MSKGIVNKVVKALSKKEVDSQTIEIVTEVALHDHSENLFKQIIERLESDKISTFFDLFFNAKSTFLLPINEGRIVEAKLSFIPVFINLASKTKYDKYELQFDNKAFDHLVKVFRKHGMIIPDSSLYVVKNLFTTEQLLTPNFYDSLMNSVLGGVSTFSKPKARAGLNGEMFVNQYYLACVTVSDTQSDLDPEDEEEFAYYYDTSMLLPKDYDAFLSELNDLISSFIRPIHKTEMVVNCLAPEKTMESINGSMLFVKSLTLRSLIEHSTKSVKDNLHAVISFHQVDNEYKIRVTLLDEQKEAIGFTFINIAFFENMDNYLKMVSDVIIESCFRFSNYCIGMIEEVFMNENIRENAQIKYQCFTDNTNKVIH